jgi:hypothetical protein
VVTKFEKLLDDESAVVSQLLTVMESYEIPEGIIQQLAINLIDSIKRFAAEYHELVVEGEITNDMMFEKNNEEAVKVYTQLLDEHNRA